MAIGNEPAWCGLFAGDEGDSPFTITGSYRDPSYYHDNIVRGGLEMDFVSAHCRTSNKGRQPHAPTGSSLRRTRLTAE